MLIAIATTLALSYTYLVVRRALSRNQPLSTHILVRANNAISVVRYARIEAQSRRLRRNLTK